MQAARAQTAGPNAVHFFTTPATAQKEALER
jgi:hypothetical protein